jgi:TolA-binding protein
MEQGKSTLFAARSKSADMTAQVESLKVKIQSLQGRIEAFEYNQKKDQNRLSESLVKELKDLQARLQRLEHPQPPAPPPPAVPSASAPPSPSPPSAATEPGPKPEKAKEIPRDSKEDQKVGATEKNARAPEELLERPFKKKAFEEPKNKEYLKAALRGNMLSRPLWTGRSSVTQRTRRGHPELQNFI